MGGYYQNCFLNISAFGVPDSDAGFLIPRQTHPTYSTIGRKLSSKARKTDLAKRITRLSAQSTGLGPPRATSLYSGIAFRKHDMFWECLIFSTRESGIRQHRSTDQETGWLEENFKHSLQYSGVEEAEGVAKALRKWYKVVEQYSRLAMSHKSDILLAISGIAECVGQGTGYTYAAGLWVEDIKQRLL
jgi:hypothetical protein